MDDDCISATETDRTWCKKNHEKRENNIHFSCDLSHAWHFYNFFCAREDIKWTLAIVFNCEDLLWCNWIQLRFENVKYLRRRLSNWNATILRISFDSSETEFEELLAKNAEDFEQIFNRNQGTVAWWYIIQVYVSSNTCSSQFFRKSLIAISELKFNKKFRIWNSIRWHVLLI